MKLGFTLAIIGLLLGASCFAAAGIGSDETVFRLGPTEYRILEWGTIVGAGLFLLGLIRIMAKALERNKSKDKE